MVCSSFGLVCHALLYRLKLSLAVVVVVMGGGSDGDGGGDGDLFVFCFFCFLPPSNQHCVRWWCWGQENKDKNEGWQTRQPLPCSGSLMALQQTTGRMTGKQIPQPKFKEPLPQEILNFQRLNKNNCLSITYCSFLILFALVDEDLYYAQVILF